MLFKSKDFSISPAHVDKTPTSMTVTIRVRPHAGQDDGNPIFGIFRQKTAFSGRKRQKKAKLSERQGRLDSAESGVLAAEIDAPQIDGLSYYRFRMAPKATPTGGRTGAISDRHSNQESFDGQRLWQSGT